MACSYCGLLQVVKKLCFLFTFISGDKLVQVIPQQQQASTVMCNLMTTETDKKKLIELLDKAEHLAAQFSGGYSGQFYQQKNFILHWWTAL